jgi:hypothetical protein
VTEPLARASVAVFVISTYDTDCLLTRERDAKLAVEVLTGAGHTVDAVD